MAHIDVTARTILGACSDGDTLRTNLVVLRRFSKYEPADSIALRRKIAHRLLDAERYIV
jgi:butyryl-CoA dehydrogenase